LMPARVVVVVARGVVQAQPHVVMRADPFGTVDHAPLEGGVDVPGWREDCRAACPDVDLSAAVGADAYLESLVVADRVGLLPEPSGHLRGKGRARTGHQIEGRIRVLPELEPVTLVEPGRHAFG